MMICFPLLLVLLTDVSSQGLLQPLRDLNGHCLRIPESRSYHRIPGDGGYEIKVYPYDENEKREFERQRLSGRLDFHMLYSESFIPGRKYTIQIRPKARTPLSYESLQAAYIMAVPSDTLEIKEPTEGVGEFEQTTCKDPGYGNLVLGFSRFSSVIEFEWTAPRLRRYPVKSGSHAQKYTDCIDIRATIVPSSNTRVFMMDSDALKITICPEPKRSDIVDSINDPLKLRRSSENFMFNDESSRSCKSSIGTKNPKPGSCCCNMAIYQIDIQSDWKRAQHFKDWPADAGTPGTTPYFTRVIGASHNSNFEMFMPGKRATPAVQDLCVDANYTLMERFFYDKNPDVLTIIATGSISSAPNSDSKRSALLAVNKTHNYISFLSKLKPSPDWCTGLPNVNLCQENCSWPRHMKIPLQPFDVGMMEGNTYMPADGPTRTLSLQPVCQVYPEHNYPFSKLDPSKSDGNIRYDNSQKSEPRLVPLGHVNLKLIRIVKDGTCNNPMMSDQSESSINWGISKAKGRYLKPNKDAANCRWDEWSPCGTVDSRDCPHQYLKDYWQQEFESCGISTTTHRCLSKGPYDLVIQEPVQQEELACMQIPWGSWSDCKGPMVCDHPRIRSRWRRFRNEREKELCRHFSSSYEFDLCWPQSIYLKSQTTSATCSLEKVQRTICSQVYPPMYNKTCPGTLTKRYWFNKDKRTCNEIDFSLNCHVAGLQKKLEIANSANVFEDEKSCQQFCQPADTCLQPIDRGFQCVNNNGQINERRWFFNPSTNECQSFTYLGCGGNFNNFESRYLCERFCNTQSIQKTEFMYSDETFSSNFETCSLSDWSEWSTCQLSQDYKCQRSRRRNLKIGPACLAPPKLFEVEACDYDQCQIDGVGKDLCLLTLWGQWSHCSRTCDRGIRVRKAIKKYSDKCPGQEEISCMMQRCP